MPARPAKFSAFLLALAALLAGVPAWAAAPAKITDVRLWSGPEGTRLVVELTAPAKFEVFSVEDPDRHDAHEALPEIRRLLLWLDAVSDEHVLLGVQPLEL